VDALLAAVVIRVWCPVVSSLAGIVKLMPLVNEQTQIIADFSAVCFILFNQVEIQRNLPGRFSLSPRIEQHTPRTLSMSHANL
jgi:hypothetical protein